MTEPSSRTLFRTTPFPRFVAAVLLAVGLILPRTARAQLIPMRTVPIAEGGQFTFFPAANYGMGDVSIAVRDSLLDPYRNPATAVRQQERSRYFLAPTFFTVADAAGGGQTLPLGAVVRRDALFAGAMLAVQRTEPPRVSSGMPFAPADLLTSPGPLFDAPSDFSPQTNRHGHVIAGRSFQAGRLAVAGSVMWSELRGMEGVELLFNGSYNVQQRGARQDVRLGVLREWSGDRSMEALLVRTETNMSYDVGYAERFWDPGTRQTLIRTVRDLSRDASTTSGLHLAYAMPLGDSGWRVGATGTVNRIGQAQSPYTPVLGVPNDAADGVAYNVGLGVSRRLGPSRVALDVVAEPMWRRSRGRADTVAHTIHGPLAPGSIVREGYFKFTNFLLRGGASHDIALVAPGSRMQVQLGMQLRNVNYQLEQHDLAASAFQVRRHSWREWTHSGGATIVFGQVEAGYHLRLASGMRRLGHSFGSSAEFQRGVFLPDPVGVVLRPVRVATHQLSLTMAIR